MTSYPGIPWCLLTALGKLRCLLYGWKWRFWWRQRCNIKVIQCILAAVSVSCARAMCSENACTCSCPQSVSVPQQRLLSEGRFVLSQIAPNKMYLNCKGKAFPLQAWTGPWGSDNLRLRIFLTFGTMKVVRSSDLHTGRIYPKEYSSTHF